MITRALAALALLPMLAGPALANPCVRCRKSVVVKRKVVVKKELAVVADIRFVPTFLATVLPAASISYTINTPPAPPAPVQAVQYQAAAVQGYAAAGAVHAQAVTPQCVTSDKLAAALEAINQRLCDLEKRVVPGAPAKPADPFNPQGVRAPAGVPGVLAAKCAVCHNDKAAANKGGGFTLFRGNALEKLDGRALAKVLAKAHTGSMPPKDNKDGVVPLTDDEVSQIAAWVEAQK